MKKKPSQPSRLQAPALRQLVERIPPFLVPRLARETGADKPARTFTPWCRVVPRRYAQVTPALGLNDVGAALRL